VGALASSVEAAGMGVMLFGVGRTFGVIIGFVKARTLAIREFVESITALAGQREAGQTHASP
jgi:hypothetical protein